ncbi:TAXI family TRAP transporter solute-binding subunit [Neobacillus niacini]|uniref:TAXI family TRAP transporter solute-binding subunit n=1 Tax=Neobacillus niacini TaxID=86668 RepID=UPI002FFE25F0
MIKRISMMGIIAVLMLITACSSSSTTSDSNNNVKKEITLTHLTTGAGLGEYEWGLTVDRILKNNHEYLRQNSLETQGYVYNLKTFIDNYDKKEQYVVNMDPISPWLAKKKIAPFNNGLGDVELAGLMNATWPIWLLITENSDIKELEDLKGKNIALGPKAGAATLMVEEVLKTAGVYEDIDIEYLAFTDITSGLLDKRIDAGLVGLWYNPVTKKTIPMQTIVELDSANRKFHYIGYSEDVLNTTTKDKEFPLQVLTVPKDTIPFQQNEMLTIGNADYVAVSKDFPEELAYDYVKLIIENIKDLNSTGGIGELFTLEFLPYRIENLHPGAERAYKEAGILKD